MPRQAHHDLLIRLDDPDFMLKARLLAFWKLPSAEHAQLFMAEVIESVKARPISSVSKRLPVDRATSTPETAPSALTS